MYFLFLELFTLVEMVLPLVKLITAAAAAAAII